MATNFTISNNLSLEIQSQRLDDQSIVYDRKVAFAPQAFFGSGLVQTVLNVGANVIAIQNTNGIVNQIYIKNTSASGYFDVQLSGTVTGGVITVMRLFPSDIFLLWTQERPNGANIGTIGLLASDSNMTVEYFLGE